VFSFTSLIFVRLKLTYTVNKMPLKYRERAKEIDEIFHNSPLVVTMITSIAP